MNVGSKGVLNLLGGDFTTISSNNQVNIAIGTSNEIQVTNGSVVIPNLVLPSVARVNLSTVKRYYPNNTNQQIKIFPIGHTNSNGYDGLEVTTSISNNFNVNLSQNKYVWTTFNSNTTTEYLYTYYLESNSSGSYNLYCATYSYAIGSTPNFASQAIPVLVTTVPTNILHNQIQVICGEINTYVLVSDGNLTISIYKSTNSGASFTLLNNTFIGNNTDLITGTSNGNTIQRFDVNVTTENITGCGLQDYLWCVAEIGSGITGSTIRNQIFVYDENTSSSYSNILGNSSYVINTPSGNLTVNTVQLVSNSDYMTYGASHSKICSTYNTATSTNEAYLILSVTDGIIFYDNICVGLKLLGSTIFQISNSIKSLGVFSNGSLTSPTPASFSVSNNIAYLPNTPIVTFAAGTYTLRTIFSGFNPNSVGDQTSFIENSISFTEFTDNVLTANTSSTLSGSVTSGQYYVNETVGYVYLSSVYHNKVISQITINNNVTSYSIFQYSSLDASSVGATPTLTISGVSIVSSEIMPLYDNAFVILSNSTISFGSTSSSTSTISFNTYSISTWSSVITGNYSNQYQNYFTSSYIDCVGIVVKQNEIFNTIISNKISGKYSFNIDNYSLASSGLNNTLTLSYSGNSLVDVMAITSSTNTATFNTINVANNSTTTPSTVNMSLYNNGNKVNILSSSLPISVISLPLGSGQSATIDRVSGALTSITSSSSLVYGSYNNIDILPIEIISLFTKRAYVNNTTSISRDDITISFINKPPFFTVDNSSNYVFAQASYNNGGINNSGHSIGFSLDSNFLEKCSVVSDVDAGFSIINDSKYYLIYDIKNNRTIVMTESFQSATTIIPLSINFTSSNLVVNSPIQIISFDSTLLNTYDQNFNNNLSVTNENNNVVSIRADYFEGFASKNILNGWDAGTICGFTEINNFAGGC